MSNRFDSRRAARDPLRIVVLDPVLASRFLLAQAIARPGFLVETAATVAEARAHLARQSISLILCDQELPNQDGLELLVELRESHPKTARALVTDQQGIGFKREAIERAGLCFMLSKPWSARALRRAIVEVLGVPRELASWTQLPMGFERSDLGSRRERSYEASGRHDEVLLRGLLAGLNSCETDAEVFELVHNELASAFRITRWLWADEVRSVATIVEGDWPLERDRALCELGSLERGLLECARRSLRVTRLDEHDDDSGRDAHGRLACLSLALRDAGRRVVTGLVWVDRPRARALVSMLRELQPGLQMALHRIRESESRASAARRLAERVSSELRTPIGALTHAIDLLRGEVERAGIPMEWIDRVSSESERVVRVVEHLEGEMSAGSAPMVSSSS